MMHEDKEFSDFDDDLGHSHTTYHGHDHSHSHGHDGSCSHESHRATSSWKNGASEDSHDHDHDHENGEEEKIKFDDVVNVVQFGAKVHLITLLQQYRDLVHQRDSKGNTLMHWAAKRGSVDILQAIFELGGKIDIASTAEPNMLPIHWAAADGKIDAIAFLLSKGQDINAQDTNGSSPAVIAAQYGQVNTIIYLYKHSADLTLSDHSGDHVLHWAAYKGNDEILQLMLYLYPREVNISDRFGQTALHLGALRGYANIVETLLKKYQADYTLRDKSGNTPLELSIEKKQNHIEFLIKRLTIKSTFELYRKAFSEDRKFLMPTLFGADDYEKCVWQWRLTFYSNLYATICLLQLTFSELLSDLFYLHTVNIIIVLFWWVFFFGCLWKDPGYITGNPYKNAKNTSNNGNNGVNHKKYPFEQGDIEEARECLLPSDQENSLYEKGLDIIGRVESSHYNPVLCHTCHVERPLRSKHDRFTNKCVHKFDHFW